MTIDQADRDAVLLALAILSLDRPGWETYLREVAGKLFYDDPRVLASQVEAFDKFRELNSDRQPSELYVALAESVKLQSHYASLLNMHDGGQRKGFANAEAWLARLREMRR